MEARRAGCEFRLRKRSHRLTPEAARGGDGARHLKKSRPHLGSERLARYRLIDEERAHYPVGVLCRVLRVSRSAYHDYHRGQKCAVSTRQAAIGEQVRAIFHRHRRRYGARRIAAELKAEGLNAGRQLVRSQMRRLGLRAIQPRCFVPRTTDSRHTAAPSPNLLLDKVNAPQQPREVVVGDITYLPLQTGKWGYLASWQDKFTKRVVGWAVEARMTGELVIKAFQKAVAAGCVRAETIVHTDRGSQYVSDNFRALLTANKCRQSMSRRANCYDNAAAESFFSRYKAELLEGGVFADVSQARSENFSYIEGYYNRVRRHSALGYKSPDEFEREINLKKKGESSERVVS
ncbi:MAG: IS3 family transposase [Acidobacteriota bacterium]|nr:IS3 family transposase [Acidobacteriota bacterium]